MFESSAAGGGGIATLVHETLGDLPDSELDAVLESILGGVPDHEVDEVCHRWLAGLDDAPPMQLLIDLTCTDTATATATTIHPPRPRFDAPAGPGLATAVAASLTVGAAGADPDSAVTLVSADLDDDQVIALVVAAERVSRWAQWARGVGMLELRTRWTGRSPTDDEPSDDDDTRDDDDTTAGALEVAEAVAARRVRLSKVERIERRCSPLRYGPDDHDLAEAFVIAETALAAGVSATQARQWLRVAADLTDRLPVCREGLRTGRLEWAKVRAVHEATTDRDRELAEVLDAIIVPGALIPDPEAHEPVPLQPAIRTVPQLQARLRAALLLLDPSEKATRPQRELEDRRVVCRPLGTATGELCAILPLDRLALIAAGLDRAAARARAVRDPRTADQVRADHLADVLTGILAMSPDATGDPATADSSGDRATTDSTGDPATADATGPIGDPIGQEDPGGSNAPDLPASPRSGSDESPSDRPPADDPVPVTSGKCSRPKNAAARTSAAGAGVLVIVSMTLETLLGLRDDPAYLERYGPIAADLARELALHGTWRCAAVDSTHGTVLGLGRPTYSNRYTPGRQLRDLLQAAYRQCSFPGCRIRAARCDVDHAVPWPSGPTCSCNTHSLCRHHHRMKTYGKITLLPSLDPGHPPGTHTWQLPSGRTYVSAPEPLLPTDPHANPHANPHDQAADVSPDHEARAEGSDRDDPPRF